MFDGIAVGKYVADAILAARAYDGSQIPGVYVPDGLPGHQVADPLNPNPGLLTPAWARVDAVRTPPVPALTSQDYTDAFNQVNAPGSDLRQNTVRTFS